MAGIMALMLFPILFYVPMSLLVTELVSAIPGAGTISKRSLLLRERV
jgi:hypothetical protein